jgi:hypothetical protein
VSDKRWGASLDNREIEIALDFIAVLAAFGNLALRVTNHYIYTLW